MKVQEWKNLWEEEKYADVSTMDKGDRKKARGGSVEGKIDRDRYVKLRRDKEKEIKKTEERKRCVLRKEAKDCDKNRSYA